MIKLFETEDSKEETVSAWSTDDVRECVKTLFTYDEEIKALQDSKREWLKEFLEQKNIPKKEFSQAVQIMKKELDTDALFEMTDIIREMKGFDD
jgi:hypothetical protein